MLDKKVLQEAKVKESFEEINTKVTKLHNFYEISWSYNISDCTFQTYRGLKYYECTFQLVVASESKTNSTYVALTF